MTNQEILDKLILRETDNNAESFDAKNRNYNAQSVKKYLDQWNMNESAFPIKDVKRYIRLSEWCLEDFDTHTELIIRKVLPKWFLLTFIRMKQFRTTLREELSSNEETLGRVLGYPMNTQDEKAFVLYEYAIQTYVEGEQE